MESMDTPKKSGIMARLRNSKGFSLIEMAIVLVIIGIIIGAIIKGQDLILNSRAKQLVTAVNSWKIAAFGYADRNGRFPGDSGKSGIIGDTEGLAATAIIDLEASGMTLPPNPVMIGGNAFWLYLGNASSPTGQPVNVVVLCKTVDCAVATTLTADEIELLKTVDTAIDGEALDGAGAFRSATKVGYTVATTAVTAAGRADAGVTGATAITTVTDTPLTAWTTASTIAAIYAFDKPW